MLKMFCDRCGKEIETNRDLDFNSIEYPIIKLEILTAVGFKSVSPDLCLDCKNDLTYNWLGLKGESND